MVEMSRYTVEAERGRRRWSLQAVEAPGAISEVDRLSQAEEWMREAISFVTGEPDNSIEIDLVPILSDTAREHLRRERELRAEAEQANSAAAAERRKAARALHSQGITLGDVGTLLGVSRQRPAQLVG